MKEIAGDRGIEWVAEGSNVDDAGDYRPGARAVQEQGVKSPLRDAGLSKQEIRLLAREAGLAVWNKESSACLASRFAYGEEITAAKLNRVEQAEDFLRDMGIPGQLRVRIHGDMARLELPETSLFEAAKPEKREQITNKLKEIGFSYVVLDLQGYRMGSMNEVLGK